MSGRDAGPGLNTFPVPPETCSWPDNCPTIEECRLGCAVPAASLAERALPAVPSWVQDAEKWQTLSRADRRALERHHRRQGKHR